MAFKGQFQSPQEGQASKYSGSEALRCVDQVTDLACYNKASQISVCRAQSLRLSYALHSHQQSPMLRSCTRDYFSGTSWKAHLCCPALLVRRPWAQGNQEPLFLLCIKRKPPIPSHHQPSSSSITQASTRQTPQASGSQPS